MEVSRERLEQLLRLARNAETYEESRKYAAAADVVRKGLSVRESERPQWDWFRSDVPLMTRNLESHPPTRYPIYVDVGDPPVKVARCRV